jgi:hypothetical protein
MRRFIFKYLVVSNVLAAVLLLISFEPLSETTDVAYEKVPPLLKQLTGDHDQQLGYVEHMLSTAQLQASRTGMVIRIVVIWLLANAVVLWRCFSTQTQSYETGPSEASK